jgi:hypothetical protein
MGNGFGLSTYFLWDIWRRSPLRFEVSSFLFWNCPFRFYNCALRCWNCPLRPRKHCNAFVSLLKRPNFQIFKIEHDTSKRTTRIETVKKSTADGFSHRSRLMNERQIFSLATNNCFIVLLRERPFLYYLTQDRFDVHPTKFHPFDDCASTTNLWNWNSDSFPQFRDNLAELVHWQSRTTYLFERRLDLWYLGSGLRA